MNPATVTNGATGNPATTILGKYTLGPLLGQGGFAKVYRARSILGVDAAADVAIKVTDKLNTNVAAAPLFIREVAAMRRLNHPNILRIHELLATKTKIYLVMELAQGGDLYNFIRRSPERRLPLHTALGIFHQLVSALHFCHLHGVSHRDLKPQNVLLDHYGNLKLSDFGLSFIDGEGSVAPGILLKTACGTLSFMAPEVMNGRRYAGAKADAWSCGIILYAMLVGTLPFDHKDVRMYRKMLGREFGLPNYLSKPVMALIYRLLDPEPDTRLCIEEIVRDPWYKNSGFGARGFTLEKLIEMNEGNFERDFGVNAFDIIGLGYGMDLSWLFDGAVGRKTRQFMVEERVGAVVERAVEVGRRLEYEVRSREDGKIWLKRGKLLVMVQVLEVAAELSMVEVVVVQGCRCCYCGGDNGGGGGQMCGGIEVVLHKYLSLPNY